MLHTPRGFYNLYQEHRVSYAEGDDGGRRGHKGWIFRVRPAIKGRRAIVGLENVSREGTEYGKNMASTLGEPTVIAHGGVLDR